jgi:hypothetical protein
LGYLANGEEVFEENFPDSSLPLRERIKVRGAVNFFTPTLILPRQWGGLILRNSFNFSLLSPCGREQK